MGATEMTANRTGRLTRLAAVIAGLAATFVILAGMQATSASAADVVGNPGVFTVTWGTDGSDGIRWAPNHLNESKFPMNSLRDGGGAVSYQINVDANGNITPVSNPSFAAKEIYSSCLTGAFLCIGAPSGVRSTPQVHPNGWTGSINPRTGVINLNMPMRVRMQSVSGSSINDCYVGANANPIAIAPSTTKSGGVAYNFNSGTARVADSGFHSPVPTGENGGGGSSNCDRTNSYPGVGLPTNDTHAFISLTIQNGAGQAVRPWPVRPAFTVSPDPVGVGHTATLNASASQVDNGVKACSDPDDAGETDCGYRWDFDGDGTVDQVTNGPTTTHVYTSSGNKTPRLTIFDVDGKSDAVTGAVWVQDPPLAQIDTTPPAVTKETVNEFTFSIPANPYSATTQCSVDGGAFTACESGDDFTFAQVDDTKADHSFRVRGITPGGVAGPADEHVFTIDRVKPRVTVNTHPVNPTNATSASFTFTADKPNSTLECQLDGGAWLPCGTNSTGSRSYSGLTQSSPNPIEAPNPHKFRVRATDQYGNIGGDGNPGGGAYDWDIDLTSPVPTFTTKPANPSNDVDPVFVWENNESIQLAQCRLTTDGHQAPWQNCGSLTTKSFSDMADATYDFSIRTLDIAGNWSNVVTHHWILETVTPPLSITSTPARYSTRTSAQFLFNAEAGSTTRCQLDSQPVQDPCPSGVKYSYLPAGTHIFSVTATDPALNETTRTYTWDIKTAKPAVAIEAASLPAASSTSADAAFALTTANGDAECRLDGSAWSDCESNAGQSYENLADGNHTFEVRAVDGFGQVSAIDAHSWLVVANAPQVSFGSTPAAQTNKTTGMFSFAVDSADDNVNTACSLNGMAATDCGSPAAVTALADGAHVFEVTATDTAGQTGTADYGWSVKAKIPGLGFDQAPAAISNSASATFEFSSDEDPDVAYECRTDNGAFAECESPVNLSALGQGSHSFTVRATDSVGNRATEAYLWKVDTIAPTVSFDQQPSASTKRIAEVLKFKASESGTTLACKLDGGSFAACTSPKLLKGLAVGAHTFTVKATDEAGNTGPEASVSWTVTDPAPSPAANGGQTTVLKGKADTRPAPSAAAGKAKAKAKRLQQKAKRLQRKAKRLRKAGKLRQAKRVRAKAAQARSQSKRLSAEA